MSQQDPALTMMLAPTGEKRSLVRALADEAAIEPRLYYEAVKAAAGHAKATDAHFMVLLVSAQKYGLDPLRKQIQLLDVGNGPEVYARVDAYKEFIQRAENAGKLESREYEEGWFLDPRQPPDKKVLRRGGRVTAKLRGAEKPVTKIVWWDEWSGKGQWANRGSHMLEHRAWKEFCRDYLGFFVADEMDAENIRRVQAETSDAPPAAPLESVVPIATLRRPSDVAEVPVKPQEIAPVTASPGESVGEPLTGSETPAPAAFDREESRRIDRLFADEGK